MSVPMLPCETCYEIFYSEPRPAVAFVVYEYSETAMCRSCLIALAKDPDTFNHSRPVAPIKSEAN